MAALIAVVALGVFLAIGGNDGVDTQRVAADDVRGTVATAPSPLADNHRDEEAAALPGSGGLSVLPLSPVRANDGTRRLILPALSADGITEPEPAVSAAAVEEVTAIPTPAPVFAPGTVQALIVAYDWPDDVALRIAYCESRYDPLAVNPTSGAAGVFQFLDYWHHDKLRPGESWFDPAVNVRIAYETWLTGGWAAWNVGGCW